ncbi:MAG: DotU family type IV/VI secretion system protein [Candidatus Cloacimonetes bacterium]|nr:DotU family type IV/VI secretion system protein [Candidatus Cloacimonadota bacterium]
MKYIDYYSELLHCVITKTGKELHSIEEFKKELINSLDQIKDNMTKANIDRQIIEHYTNFAVVAFIDTYMLNFILDGDREGRIWWLQNSLQSQIYEINDAGVKYYEKIKDIDAMTGKKRIDLMEFYLLILYLGFEGQYDGTERLAIIRGYAERCGLKEKLNDSRLGFKSQNNIIHKKEKGKGKGKYQKIYLHLYYAVLFLIAVITYFSAMIGLSGVMR